MKHIRLLFAAALALGLMGVASAQGKGPTKDLILKGDAKCTTCHDEADKPQVLNIGRTKHGTIADKRVGTCTACHGESKQHIAEAEGGSKTPAAPDVGFGKKSKTPMTARSEACLTCHQGGDRSHWQASTHANRDTACTSCHQVHTSHDQARDKFGQSDVCFACHKEQRSQINKPWHHPVREGKMGCSDCHNVHGDNPKQLNRASTNEVCYTCHMEKRGPFVHNHQPVTEDCSICHNPHGSVIAGLLKQRAPYLCQECHSHTSHPGQTPGIPVDGLRTSSTSRLGTIARGCLNCHTNIHGGNSTVNSATAGRFRR
ncbi:MAG: cytochrome C [Betaproteobacteria bacterium SG8_39]|nr:MAG: cytochrome C [Betaproteobacteria bacterium SG8_39]